MLQLFAHAGEDHSAESVPVAVESSKSVADVVQQPYVAIPLVTIVAMVVIIGGLYLYQRYSPWQLPGKKEK